MSLTRDKIKIKATRTPPNRSNWASFYNLSKLLLTTGMVLGLSGPLEFANTQSSLRDSAELKEHCLNLLLETEVEAKLSQAWGNGTTAKQILEYFFSIGREYGSGAIVKDSQKTDDETRRRIAIANWFEIQLLPTLKSLVDNRAVQSSGIGEGNEQLAEEFQALIAEDRANLLGQLNESLPKAYQLLYQEAGLGGESVLLEFGPHPDLKLDERGISRLMRMYSKISSRKGWNIELLNDDADSTARHAVFRVTGTDVIALLAPEMGVHRFISKGSSHASAGNRQKTHTAYVEVRVYPEPSLEAFDFRERDVEMSFTHSSGPGGQNVNKVATAVIATHRPTGLTVKVQSQRTQIDNRRIALAILRSKAFDRHRIEEERKRQSSRQITDHVSESRWVRTYDERLGESLNVLHDGISSADLRQRSLSLLGSRLSRLQ